MSSVRQKFILFYVAILFDISSSWGTITLSKRPLGCLKASMSKARKAQNIPKRTAVSAKRVALSQFCENWQPEAEIEAISEQTPPLFLGSTPSEMVQGISPQANPMIPEFMRKLGIEQASLVTQALGQGPVEFETWPVEMNGRWPGDLCGMRTWVFARWRKHPADPWTWLDEKILKKIKSDLTPLPVLPKSLQLTDKEVRSQILTDAKDMPDLYDKPLFSEIVWTTTDGNKILGAWLPSTERENNQKAFNRQPSLLKTLDAKLIPRPAFFNEKPITFFLKPTPRGEGDGVVWPSSIRWRQPLSTPSTELTEDPLKWPNSFKDDYTKDLEVLSGKTKFTRKNSGDPHHQLEDMVDYFENRYHALGLETERIRFKWRGIPQSNLIVKIKGSFTLDPSGPSGSSEENKPILMADHFDTAFMEDVFEKTGKRLSAPGADDNASATATLLRAAELLKDTHPKHDIWLVHLTGEEFPAESLGVRALIHHFRKTKQKIGGVVLLDMIGYNPKGGKLFQINPGDSARSLEMAALAQSLSHQVNPSLIPKVRTRFDPKSYLYNTDGQVFEQEGYPIILLNENMHRDRIQREGYHDSHDTLENMDLDYATSIAKTAIATVRALANQ